MYQGMCRASIEQRERLEIWLDGLDYVSRGIERNLENLHRKGLCREVSKRYRTCYRASIEQTKTWFFKEEKQHDMNANKIDTKPNIKEAC